MERAVDLPIELRRLIYQRYLQARARHLWNAVRQFAKRLQTACYWVDTTRFAELSLQRNPAHDPADSVFERMRRLSFNLDDLLVPERWTNRHRRTRRLSYNIRPQRGVKRPLEEFL